MPSNAGRVRSDATVLQDLLDCHWCPLVRYAESLGLSQDCAEDAAQEAFLALWQSPGGVSGASVRAYLFQVVRNLGAREHRRTQARSRLAGPVALELYPHPATPHDDLERARRLRVLEDALSSLPPRRREALVLARFHHLSHDEIAGVLGLSSQTVANHISLALRDLRAVMLEPLAL